MSADSVTSDRGDLYVVSCRKRDPRFQAANRPRSNAPEVYLNTPKRAGTYVLLRGPSDSLIEEDALVAEPGDDTDAGESPDRARTQGQRENWRVRQRATEDRIAGKLSALGPLVLYVHGFNTKPAEALRAGVRIQQHLDRNDVGATVVVFTWPSAGHLADYFPDQRAAGRFGSYALVNLLMSLHRDSSATAPIHCVAHSMGTYVVTRALSTIATLHMEVSLPPGRRILSEVAYMQPDIDYDILCSGYTGPSYDSPSYLEIPDGYGATEMAQRLTVYCTTNDMALFGSLFKNRTKRLGAYGPGLEAKGDAVTVMTTRVRQNVHVVNCDEWCVFDLLPQHSHSHFLECPRLMADVARVLKGDPADANPARIVTRAPRWYRLRYAPLDPAHPAVALLAMASLWRAVGSLAVNPIVVFLVKWKKRVQMFWRIATGIVPVAAAGVTGVMAWLTHHLLWQLAFLLSVGTMVFYVPLWVRARQIQKREDE